MRQRRIYVIGGLVLLFFITISLWSEVLKTGSFEVTFFNVHQGDAAFILTPQGHQIVIDGGPSRAILKKLSQKIPFWDKTVDMVILSHPAQDHVAGLLDVLQKYQVKTILWTGIEKDTKIFQEWKKAVAKEQEEGATVSFVKGSETVFLQEGSCPHRMDILFPLEDLAGKQVMDDNDTSIVVRFEFCLPTGDPPKGDSYSVLFTGDLTAKREKKVLEQDFTLASDILKVGHHGSKTSSSEEFVRAVSPDIAVISVGAQNRYGHPHQETLATFAKYGIEIRRTDEEGDIAFRFK